MNNSPAFIAVLIMAMIVWGVSWPVGKMISSLGDTSVIVFWRFALGAIGILPVLLWQKHRIAIFRKEQVYAGLGGLLLALYNWFFFEGLLDGFPGKAGVLVTTLNPPLTFLVAAVFFRQNIARHQYTGLALGLLAGVLLLELWRYDASFFAKGGNLFFLGCSLCWAFVSLAGQQFTRLSSRSKKDQRSATALTFTFWTFVVCALVTLPVAITAKTFIPHDTQFWILIFFLSIITNSFATMVYFVATQKLGASLASAFIFLVPVSNVIVSWFWLNETPLWNTIAGGCIAVLSVWILKKKSPEMPKITERQIGAGV
ncbi:MAG: DMT family transporter [Leptospiraceae bacterium]|nr:DMT family transporter [Leptospiraceae bacterium]